MTHVSPPNPQLHQMEATCTLVKCKLRQLNDSTYRTRHAPGCQGSCSFVGADPDHLANILVDHKSIPLIDASPDWDNVKRFTCIDLKAWDGVAPFVAISHVWADGLGNPQANALPRCQMMRLSKMVQNLTGRANAYFWLDTICVPPDDALNSTDRATSHRQRLAQDFAMTKMRETYEKSEHVLVLDSWLYTYAHRQMTDVEKLMRIFSSGWTTRLWTYQEGALGERTSFQLLDEIYEIDRAIEHIQHSNDWPVVFALEGPLVIQYHSLRGFRHLKPERAEKIKFLGTALSLRTTSVAADETLCLSALMGFDVQEILDVQNPIPGQPDALVHARMKKFWSMFDEIPLAMIRFEGPTLKGSGWAWAPSTLLLSKDRPLESYKCFLTPNSEPALRTNKGLIVPLEGLKFHSNVPLGLEFYVEDEQHVFYHFYFKLTKFQDRATKYTHNHSGIKKEEVCIDPQAVRGSNTLAFLFDQIHDPDEHVPAHKAHMTETGIMVAPFKDSDGHWKATKIGYAVRKTMVASLYNDPEVVRRHIHASEKNLGDFEASRLAYPAASNGTLLCTRGQRVQRKGWCLA